MSSTETLQVPLVFDFDEMSEWLLSLPEEQLTLDALDTAMSRLGRNYEPALVATMYWEREEFIRPHLPELVIGAWGSAEFPSSCLDPYVWEELFSEAGFTVNGKPAHRPKEPVRVYRGAAPEHKIGWSWTPDREQAEWFRDRFNFDGSRKLYTMLAQPLDMLAILDGTTHRVGESEVVLDAFNDGPEWDIEEIS